MSENTDLTYYQKNRDVLLNKAKDYFKNNKARDRYRNLTKEEKNKEREYGENRYCNMSEEKKQRLKRIPKNLSRGKKVSIY